MCLDLTSNSMNAIIRTISRPRWYSNQSLPADKHVSVIMVVTSTLKLTSNVSPIMPIILGLDIGDARTGVAISDELGIAAHPLCTIQRKSRKALLTELQELATAHKVERIVVGLPLQLNGETGAQAQKIKKFAEKLAQHVNLPIVFWDESFTTFEATQILRGTKKRRKKRKQIVDQVAAVLILDAYLEELRNSRRTDESDKGA